MSGTPELKDVVEAVTKVNVDFAAFKEAFAEREKELCKKGDVDPLLDEKLKKINDAMSEQQKTIDQFHLAMKRKHLTVDGKQVDVADLDAKALAWAQFAHKCRGTTTNEFTHEDMLAYKKAFEQYVRKDDRIISDDEKKALSVGSDPNGGYLVSPDTSGRIVERQFETSAMRSYASVQMISTDSLEGLYDLDEAGSGWVGETAARTETDTPELKVWRIPVLEQYAEPRATQKLLDDAQVDVEAWLARKVADKLTRVENEAFVNGSEAYEPRGFLTYAAGTTNPGTIEQTNTGANGAFATAPDGANVLILTQGKLKSNYKRNASWFMNRTTAAAARLLKDSNGAMMWQPSLQAGQPATLLGDPIASFEDMPTYSTTGALAIAYGDMAAAYQVVERMGIRVLRDPYTAKPWVKFYTTKRVGGDVIDFDALKLIKFSS